MEMALERYKQRKGSALGANDIKFLKKELRSIRAAVSMVSDLPQDRLKKQAKLVVREWRELSYDIEDVLDTLLALGKIDDPGTGLDRSEGKGLVVEKMTNPLSKKERTGRHIADKISELRIRIMEFARRRYGYHVKVSAAAPAVAHVDPRAVALFEDTHIRLVGIAEARDELIRRLTEGGVVSQRQLKIVSLVGLGGLGKTTLAHQLYQEIRSTFECRAFVSVSQSPNMKRVFFDMFIQLGIEEYSGDMREASWDQTKAIDKLKNFLQSKRYLIVVDDIWDTKSWIIIKKAMVDNNLGSRIITTTRKLDVAEEIGGAYKVKPLSDESSRILFYTRIFGSDECPNNEISEMSDNILKKCGGVPLTVISIASLLARSKRLEKWHEVMDSFFGAADFGQNLLTENIRMIFSLSYNNLPFHLKTCLLHVGVFPKGKVIRRDRLVWIWIAEGFIQEKQGCNLFEVGQSYLDELLNSNMIQDVDIIGDDFDDSGMVKYCCVPTIVHCFICCLSSEENFVTEINGRPEQPPEQGKIRRIYLQNGAVGLPRDLATDMHLSGMRSFTAFGPEIYNLMPVLSSFQVLRVLDLEGTDLQSYNLKNLGKLLCLRYLGLRGTLTAELPKEIGNLGILQVLDLKGTRIKELPSTVARLRRMLCLYVECTTKLPQGMGKLASLEQVSKISITESPMFAEQVSSLLELRVLGIVLQQDDIDESLQKSFLELLCNLHKLQTLRIFGRGGGKLDLEHFVKEGWVPPPELRRFVTVDCWFSALPTWITSVNLSELQIGVRKLWQEGLQILGSLQQLLFLQLAMERMMEKLEVDADAFPRLRVLRLRCGTCLVFRRGAMPAIRTLEFVLDLGISSGHFDWGLENLILLEQVRTTLRRGHGSAAEVLEAEAALKNAVSIHPNRPDLKITKEQEDANEENSSAGPSEIRECSA